MITPSSSTEGRPTIQKVSAPSAPWTSPTTTDPLIVARTMVRKRSASRLATCRSIGSAAMIARPIARPSRSRKKPTYSAIAKDRTNPNTLPPKAIACVAIRPRLACTNAVARACTSPKSPKPALSSEAWILVGSAANICAKYIETSTLPSRKAT